MIFDMMNHILCRYWFSNSNCSNFLLPAARILSKQQVPEADEAWRALIQHNPDRYESFRGYLENLGLPLGKS